MSKKGMKFDSKKVRLELIPVDVMNEVGKVLTFGAEKYGKDNWQELEDLEDRYYGAMLRHIRDWRLGKGEDDESGINHMAHAITNAIFLMWNELEKEKEEEEEY